MSQHQNIFRNKNFQICFYNTDSHVFKFKAIYPKNSKTHFFSDWREKLENRCCNERMAVVPGVGFRPTRRGWGALYSREGGGIAQQLYTLTCDAVKEAFLRSHRKVLLLTLMYWYKSQHLVLCRRIDRESSKSGYRDTYLYSSSKPRASYVISLLCPAFQLLPQIWVRESQGSKKPGITVVSVPEQGQATGWWERKIIAAKG